VAGSSSAPIVDRLRIIPRADDFLDRNFGSSGEVFFSRDTNTLRVYSGKDVSGFEIARADLNNVDLTSFLQTSTLATTSVSALSDVNYVSTPTVGQILSWDDTYQAFIPTDADLSGGNSSIDVSETAPTTPASGNLWLNTATGKLYIYIDDGTSTQWIEPATTGGGGSSNAITLAGQSASYYLDYNNVTNTPTIPTNINSLSDVTATGPSDGQILKWSTSNSAWELASDLVGGAGGVQLSDFSITANAVGTAALSYDNTTGVFTYTPPDLTSYLTSYSETSGLNDVVSRGSTTAQAVTINNTLTVGNVVTNGSGTPEIVSTSTITLDAPDGTIVQSGPFRLPSFTTAQKNAQSSVNGDMVYDSTLNKAQVYENGAWANLA
jgi:hypothetical protein